MDAIGEDGSYDRRNVRPTEEIAGSGYTYFKQGDVIRARVTPCFENGKGALLSELVGGRGFGTTELFVFMPSERIDSRFLYYLTTSADFTARGSATMYGAHGVRRVDEQFARNYRAWLPSLARQREIADHLDGETARIEHLIDAKRRMWELLNQRLDAEMDSLLSQGEVRPVKLGKVLARKITDGPHETPKFLAEGTPFISVEAIVENKIDMTKGRFISPEDHAEYSQKCKPEPGDVLLVKTGATIGKTAVVDEHEPFSIWSPLALLRPKKDRLRPRYLWFYLRKSSTQRLIREFATQSTQPNISMGDIAALPIQVPSLPRQDQILKQLNRSSEIIARSRSILERQVALLNERRQSLITAAITGQLDCQKAA